MSTTLELVRAFVRGKTHGGYVFALVMDDGESLCRACAEANYRQVFRSTRDGTRAADRINVGIRQVVQPWWFGDPEFKATGFELIGLPPLVPTRRLAPPQPGSLEHASWSRVHRASPSATRWKERSRTFAGMANAIATQWG